VTSLVKRKRLVTPIVRGLVVVVVVAVVGMIHPRDPFRVVLDRVPRVSRPLLLTLTMLVWMRK
jgi:hypothetical protein